MNHLKQEIMGVADVNQGLQRKWISTQRELIDLKVANASLAETTHALETEKVILIQRHERLLKL